MTKDNNKNRLISKWDMLEFQAQKIFTPSAPISEADLFNGRSDQIKQIVKAVFERGRHAVLYGERGVGKTSLGNTFHKLMKGVGIMPIRKQSAPDDDFTSLWKNVFDNLIYEITAPDYGFHKESTAKHKVADKYNHQITPDDVVKELAQFSLGKNPVIIFDEFDKVKDAKVKELMAHTIKSLSDNNIKITIILIGVADDINALVEEHQSVSRNIEEIKMPRMSDGELNEILDDRIPKLDMKIEGDARWKIVTLSRGLPEYAHSLGRDSAIQAITEKKKTITENHVDGAIESMLSQSGQSINRAYRKAIHSNKPNALYKEVLLACAMVETDDEGQFTPSSLVEPLSGILNKKISISTFQQHLAAFVSEKRGNILEKLGIEHAYKYRFTEPKMQPYVIMHGMSNGMISSDASSILSAPEQRVLFSRESDYNTQK